MNDLTKLKELAERASALHGTPSLEHSAAITEFRSAANPQAILGLIAEIEEHDGILNVWRGRTQRAEAEAERLKAENEALREKLNDCAISLHGEMLQKYGGQMPEDMHPVTRRNYDRDMAEVEEYRAALEGGADDRP
ncbi:hypothetical protein A9C11_23265 [Pseudomonas citronellolis]|jgi:hypothetical protein|uniref:Ead/Ea22-like family protein n=1 Tax=Pseudomonas citronellolis TaxID=53408 RepID=A0A1A9KFX6_9PSED|nr:hypothetical protein [Pseudomonas citronellolis]ANI14431.1 hypothetical protein A9C11_10745 [Pseudomonas citronellolis]ANI16706.1 hypothetical protein A9C11_23265 [Pseudomonas citronellolis]